MKKITIIFLIFSLILIAGIFYRLFLSTGFSNSKEWEILEDQAYGISIEYPKTWHRTDNIKNELPLFIEIEYKKDINDSCLIGLGEVNWKDKSVLSGWQDERIGNIIGKQKNEDRDGMHTKTFVFSHKNQDFRLMLWGRQDYKNLSECNEVFEKMLSSLFIN